MNQIVVRDAKGAKDRVTILPTVTKGALAEHLQRVKRQYEADLARGAGWVELPWPSTASTRMPAASGSGNGSSPPPGSTSMAQLAGVAGITSRDRAAARRARSRPPGTSRQAGHASHLPPLPPHICLKTDAISARFRSSWATTT
jgi:hypothetical protein